MNIKWTAYASDLQLRFWRWVLNLTEVAMNHGPIVQRAIYIAVVVIAGLLAFTLGRLAGELIASLII
jgi:hypothetical protein